MGGVSVSARPGTDELEVRAIEQEREWYLASWKSSIELYLEAAEARLQVGETRKAADNLRNAAALAIKLRDLERARALLDRAIKFERRSGYVEGEIISLALYSDVERRSGKAAAAAAANGQANKIRLTTPHFEAEAARSFSNAEHAYAKFDLPGTIDHAAKARELWIRSGNVERQIEANSLIAYARAAQYEPIEADKLVDESIDLAMRTGDRRSHATVLAQKAFVTLLMNEPIKALKICQDAERMFPADLDLGEQAQLANGIGGIYWQMGDWKMSNAYSLKAFDLFGRDRSPKGQLATLVSLIDLSFTLGDPAKAFDYYRQGEVLSHQIGNDYFIAIADRFVANHYLSTGNIETAITYYERSLARLNASGFKSGISAIRSNLGEAFLRKGDLTSAREHFRIAHEMNTKASDRFAEAQSLFDLARLRRAEGDRETAGALINQSILLTEKLRDNVLNQKLRSEYFATVLERYGFGVDILVREGKFVESLRLAERGRARETAENLSVAHAGVIADADEDILNRERSVRINLNAKADKLTDLLRRGETEEVTRAVELEINDLQHQLEEIKSELKQNSPVYSAIKDPPAFDLVDFQTNVLGENDILLEYFLGSSESYLWLVGKGEFEAYVLPGREVIETKVDELRRLLDARRPLANETFQQMRERVVAADAAYTPLARELSDMILGPVAEGLTGKRLIVVPDGKLHYFSINALPLPKSDSDEPILLTNEVVYQPSAQTLSLLAKFRSSESEDRGRDLLVFSDPVFSRDDARLPGNETARAEPRNTTLSLRFAESLEGLQRLPASGSEADAITEIVGSRNTDLFSGFAATRDRLLNARLSDYKVIHLATHGIVDHERPELSAVVLSRFDEAGKPMDESVRLQDIYGMKLNADLVVLSACQTASGKEIKGEGVMGLNSAFLQAGARSVVASLWQVDDNASNQLMREFYSGMAEGMPVSSALRQAQIALYRDPQFRSPFFWAAYTLQGDMNRRPEIGHSFSAWWIAAVPLGLVIVLIVRFRRSRRRTKAVKTT